MGNVDKWIEPIEKQIAGMDNISVLEIDKTVTIGVSVGHMDGADIFAVEVESDIVRERHDR